MGTAGCGVVVTQPHLVPYPALAFVGFALIAATALVQFSAPRLSWLTVEESMAASAGVLIVGLGSQRLTILTFLWLVAIVSGVLARGGRVHWIGRSIVLLSLALPVIRSGSLAGDYIVFCVATIGLLLTSGRLTGELNLLLRQAREHAETAETLLYAGDIAARMSEHSHQPRAIDTAALAPAGDQAANREALARLIDGKGISMAVQPIVDIRSGTVHAYEALARFEQPLHDGSPLHWFELAEQLGQRPSLERACLKLALELYATRPPGTSVSVNLSAPVLLEDTTIAMLGDAAGSREDTLDGLIIEITEETLVRGETDLSGTIAPLRARGAVLAVDDMGAGYSGLRQITSVLPGYLKLDRSLITGIDRDSERAALVAALAGYARQVGTLLVAEGVETGAELDTVRSLGVPLVQGYYLSRPGEPWPAIIEHDTGRAESRTAFAASQTRSTRALEPA